MSQPVILLNGVGVTDEGSVRTIRFASAKANSLNSILLAELARAIAEASAQPEVRSILLESAGDGAFCAGASFEEMERLSSENEAQSFFMGFGRVVLAMIRSPKLIVCRVQGKAVGGGVGIVAASDYVIAAQDASVRLSELEIGLGPFVIAAAVERRIGAAHFHALSCDTEWRDSGWCLANGLFHRVSADRTALEDNVKKLSAKFASYAPEAVSAWKSLLWSGTEGWEALFMERAQTVGSLALKRKK